MADEYAKALRADEKAWRKARATLMAAEFLRALEWALKNEGKWSTANCTMIEARIAELKRGMQ